VPGVKASVLSGAVDDSTFSYVHEGASIIFAIADSEVGSFLGVLGFLRRRGRYFIIISWLLLPLGALFGVTIFASGLYFDVDDIIRINRTLERDVLRE